MVVSVVSTYNSMYWYSIAVCIGLYTRYQYIFYLGACTFVHDSLLYVHICVTKRYVYRACLLYVLPSQLGKVANPARGQLAEQGK